MGVGLLGRGGSKIIKGGGGHHELSRGGSGGMKMHSS